MPTVFLPLMVPESTDRSPRDRRDEPHRDGKEPANADVATLSNTGLTEGMVDDVRRALERIAFGPTRMPDQVRAAEDAASELARLDAEPSSGAREASMTGAGRGVTSARGRRAGERLGNRTRVGAGVMSPVPPRPPRPAWRNPGLIVGVVIVLLCALTWAGFAVIAAVLQDRPNAFLGAQGLTAKEVRALDITAFDIFDRPATDRELRYLDELEVGGRIVQLGPRILTTDDDWDYAAVIIRSLITTIEPRVCVWALGEAGSALACTELSDFAEVGVEGSATGRTGTVNFRWSSDGAFTVVPVP